MKRTLILALGASALLAACGGGGDDAAPAPAVTEQVPPEASKTVTAFVGYLKALVVSNADTLEPVDVSAVMPPSDEAVEPTSVD